MNAYGRAEKSKKNPPEEIEFREGLTVKKITSTPHKDHGIEKDLEKQPKKLDSHISEKKLNHKRKSPLHNESKVPRPEKKITNQQKKFNPLINRYALKGLINKNYTSFTSDDLVTDTIDYYIEVNGQRDKCCVFENREYDTLQRYDCFDGVIRKMYWERALNKDSIFAPMCVSGNHWVLTHIQLDTKTINIYNSMNTDAYQLKQSNYDALKKALIAIYASANEQPPLDEFRVNNVRATQQLNGLNDCGIAVFHFADKIMKNESFSNAEAIHELRKEMYEKLKNIDRSFLTKEKVDETKEKHLRRCNKFAHKFANENRDFKLKVNKEELLERHIPEITNSNDWTVCHHPQGCQEDSKDETKCMIKCILCRKWMHLICLDADEIECVNEVFFRCTDCNRKKEKALAAKKAHLQNSKKKLINLESN